MATIQTTQFGSSTCPRAQLVVTESSSTATTSTLSWTLKWVTYGYTVSSSYSKPYVAKINGTTVASGSFTIGGVTSRNIASGTVTITKGTSAKTIPIYVSFDHTYTWSGTYGGTKTASGTISVSAKTSYSVSYNANGGSGAPTKQTKWYGTNLTLSAAKPTRSNYTFAGWATSSGGGVSYSSGGTYSSNASITLYAVWTTIGYTVSYNANGGSGAPGSQTKINGTTLTLTSATPSRSGYTFMGWATSSTGGVAYASGASYTCNKSQTLYAVWQAAYTPPKIYNIKTWRCVSASNSSVDDQSNTVWISFSWSVSTSNPQSISIITYGSSSGSYSNSVPIISGLRSDSESMYAGSFASEGADKLMITVTDTNGASVTKYASVPGKGYPIDFKAGGSGTAIGKAAETANLLDINYPTRARKTITMDNNTGMYMYDTGGTARDMVRLDGSNCAIFGYGTRSPGYSTYLDGENIYVRGDSSINSTSSGNNTMTANTSSSIATVQGYNTNIKSTNSLSLASTGNYVSMTANTSSGTASVDAYNTTIKARNTLTLSSGPSIELNPTSAIHSTRVAKVLWSGAYYMTGSHTAYLNETVSSQLSGIVLHWQRYNSGTQNNDHSYTFIPKSHVASYAGAGVSIFLTNSSIGVAANKYVYVNNNSIVGHDLNDDGETSSSSGITRTSNGFVLTQVLGV